MSDSEEENFCYYGKPLEPYDEDLFPKRRPIAVEEQIATDSHGRRRFHGAFTGGFSAGFFNTVGSLEGWTPSEFKSTRGEKQKSVTQNAEDFMDDEDMGEFGFAPNVVRSTKEYDTSNKRKRKVFADGPIPGEPVLHSLLTAGNESIGYLLLKNIGIHEKINTKNEELSSSSDRVYGCEMPKASALEETVKRKDYEIPTLYQEYLSKPKNDTFGLGYQGLSKIHGSLFKSTNLVVHEKDKKLSIHGQAFGVGAFENEDDDIYSKDDMSNYDFELTKEKEKPVNHLKNSANIIFDLFIPAKINSFTRKIYPPPVIPQSFTGKYKVKKSRFEPIEVVKVEKKNIDPTYRAELLGEEVNKTVTKSQPIFPKKSPKTTSNGSSNEEKSCDSSNDVKSQDKKKFDTSDLWSDRFVSGVQDDETTNALAPVDKYQSEHYGKEMRDAAKLKMFGPLTRISEDWQPCSLLCKRFNVPEPMADKQNSLRKRNRSKNLIFEYQKHHDENLLLKPGLSSQKEEPLEPIPEQEIKQEIEEEKVDDVPEIISQTNDDSTEKKLEADKNENVDNDVIVDLTDRLNIEEKTDLFKAIFLDSSESEGEEESEKNEDPKVSNEERQLELKSNILGETLIPKIKPVKMGILSDIKFHEFKKPEIEEEKKVEETTEQEACSVMETNTYGPLLPEKLSNKKVGTLQASIIVDKSDDSCDEWVEKDSVKKTKKNKHRKEKSHKKKHKHKKNKKVH